MEQSLSVANYFIEKSFESGTELTPMKLVKLVYIAHGWHLGLTGEPLLNEKVEAWKYGPVIESVYQAFKKYGAAQIPSLYTAHGGSRVEIPRVKEELRPFLDKVWDVYKDYNGVELSTLTHQKGTPWDIVWNESGRKTRPSAMIANDIIKSHYKQLVQHDPAA